MKNYREDSLVIENARIFFRNFAGKGSKFNREGNRNFCVEITDPAIAGALMEDGWNVRTTAPREDDDEERYYIQVNVNYNIRNQATVSAPNGDIKKFMQNHRISALNGGAPRIRLFTKNGPIMLTEETVEALDYADIACVNRIEIRPYNWEMGGRTGVKGYVSEMDVTIVEDEYAEPNAAGFAEGTGEDDEDLPF